MKKLFLLLLLLPTILFFSSCSRRTQQVGNLLIYQPIGSNLENDLNTTFFEAVRLMGFNTLLLSPHLMHRQRLEESIALAQSSNLAVILELEYRSNTEQEIEEWILRHRVDGFVINSTDNLNEARRRRLRYTAARHANTQHRSGSLFGTQGLIIGRSHHQNEASFIKATFGLQGENEALQLFINSIGEPILTQSLLPESSSPNLLILYHNLRNLYGRRAQAISVTPMGLASDAMKSASLAWYIGTLPQPMIYPALIAPQYDDFAIRLFPEIFATRESHQAFQQGQVRLLSTINPIYSDLVEHRSQQFIRVHNFGDTPTIFSLNNIQNIVRGQRLVDIHSGEELQRDTRGFRIRVEASDTRIFRVERR